MKIKSAILHTQNEELIIDDVELQPLKCGQVLVKVINSGICGAQLGEISGAAGKDKYLPHLLGHEGAGIVVETGKGVRHISIGDHVVMHWRKGVGIDAVPAKYYWNKREIGGGQITTFSSYSVVSENRLTVIDSASIIPSRLACLLGCSITTALGLVNNEAKIKIGESVLILGAGGMGVPLVQACKMVSANPIEVLDLDRKKLDEAERHGASKTMTSLNTVCYDVVIDTTGNVELINQAFQLVKPQGRMILVGQSHHTKDLLLTNFRQHYKGKVLLDSQGGLINPTIDIPKYLNLYLEDKLNLDDMYSHIFDLDNINGAVSCVNKGIIRKALLNNQL